MLLVRVYEVDRVEKREKNERRNRKLPDGAAHGSGHCESKRCEPRGKSATRFVKDKYRPSVQHSSKLVVTHSDIPRQIILYNRESRVPKQS